MDKKEKFIITLLVLAISLSAVSLAMGILLDGPDNFELINGEEKLGTGVSLTINEPELNNSLEGENENR